MQKLVCVNEWADDDERAENVPQPVGCGSDRDRQSTSGLFGADTGAELVEPDKSADAKGQPADEEEHEAVVHGAFAVTSGGDEVQGFTDFAHLPDVVDA